MSKRSRRKRLKRLAEGSVEIREVSNDTPVVQSNRKGIARFYDVQYKKLLFVTFFILFLAIAQVSYQMITTGDFLIKGVTLKGGVTITIPVSQEVDAMQLEAALSDEFPEFDMNVRNLRSAGITTGVILEVDTTKAEAEGLITSLEEKLNVKKSDFGIEEMGSSLGSSFFKETVIAVIIAFLFMGIVVFLYFRSIIPSVAVILCAFSDIIITIAIVNLMGMRISTAGIAGFLMLIGYSVDTDILLSTRILKRKGNPIFERVINAMKTGLTMTLTTISAIIVALLMSQSEVLTQIMTILLIGLFVDIIMTWIQNVGILRLYVKGKNED